MKLRKPLVVLCAVAGAFAPSLLAQPQGPTVAAEWNDRESSAGPDPLQGRFVAIGGQFGELSYACVSCHQLDGTADRSGAIPRIAGQSEQYLNEALRQFATGKRPSAIMGPIASELTRRDMENVAAFYAGISDQPFPPRVLPPNFEVFQQGRQIAMNGDMKDGVMPCVMCHGDFGVGNAPNFPYLLGQFEPYLAHQLRKFKAGKRPSDIMTRIASGLSDDQIAAVSAYFSWLRPGDLPSVSTVTPEQAATRKAGERQPERPKPKAPHLGATMNPKPGQGDVVVPGASTRR